MGSYNRDDRGGRSFEKRSFGPKSFNRGGDRGRDRQMFKTICSNCGNDCEVPFRPTSGKPVYCSNCFEKMGDGKSDNPRSDRPEFRSPRQERPDYQLQGGDQNKRQFELLNYKLDAILKLLEPKSVQQVKSEAGVEVTKQPKSTKAKKETVILASEEKSQ